MITRSPPSFARRSRRGYAAVLTISPRLRGARSGPLASLGPVSSTAPRLRRGPRRGGGLFARALIASLGPVSSTAPRLRRGPRRGAGLAALALIARCARARSGQTEACQQYGRV